MEQESLTKNQHGAILILMGIMLAVILLVAGISLPEFWFWVVWVIIGLGGWSHRYYFGHKTNFWVIIPSAILGGAAMLYHLDRMITER